MNVIEEKYNWAYPLTRRSRTALLVLRHEAGSELSGAGIDVTKYSGMFK